MFAWKKQGGVPLDLGAPLTELGWSQRKLGGALTELGGSQMELGGAQSELGIPQRELRGLWGDPQGGGW